MKLTRRGRDYLKGVITLALISSVFDIKSMIALSFALAITALISFLVLSSISMEAAKISVSPESIRKIKGEEFPLLISIAFKRARWVVMHLSSLKLPEGVIVKSKETYEGKIRLTVKSPYSGLFKGMEIRLGLSDTLGLFSKELRTIDSPFALESLPFSILHPIHALRALPLSVGDRSARAPGSSLELYSLDEYQPFSDTKNLLWKKIARMPDEKLIVRVREAMIPKVARIGLIEHTKRSPGMKLRFKDLFCEGMGIICNNLFASGTFVEILSINSESSGGIQSTLVSNIEELTDALFEILGRNADSVDTDLEGEVVALSDIVVCGLSELEDESMAFAISKKPSLLIQEEAAPAIVGDQSVMFSGLEDLRKLVSKVIEK